MISQRWYQHVNFLYFLYYIRLVGTMSVLIDLLTVGHVTDHHPSKHETLAQYWFNVGPESETMGQHWINIGSVSRVCWDWQTLHSRERGVKRHRHTMDMVYIPGREGENAPSDVTIFRYKYVVSMVLYDNNPQGIFIISLVSLIYINNQYNSTAKQLF